MKFINCILVMFVLVCCSSESLPVTNDQNLQGGIILKGLNLNIHQLQLEIGDDYQFSYTIQPSDVQNVTVSWSTEDDQVISVSSTGQIAALSAGSTVITLTSDTSDFFDSCLVSVIEHHEIKPAGEDFVLNNQTLPFRVIKGFSFLQGSSDNVNVTVDNDFLIAESELEYRHWNTVYSWATGHGYTFVNTGTMGDGTDDTVLHPVTGILWSEAVIWCNAMTEYYNSLSDPDLELIYYDNSDYSTISRTALSTSQDFYVKENVAGFRLLTHEEWELAARYIKDKNGDGELSHNKEFYPGDYASGSDSSVETEENNRMDWDKDIDVDYTDDVAVYDEVSASVVKSLKPNCHHLFDLSGNVSEWVFTISGSNRRAAGGAYNQSSEEMKVSYYTDNPVNHTSTALGFRIASYYSEE